MRTWTAGALAEVQAQTKRPVFLVKGEFGSGDLNLWSGVGPLAWNGDTYTGTGHVLRMTPVTETTAIKAEGLEFTLMGVKDKALLPLVEQTDYQGRRARLWLGFMTDMMALVPDPAEIFRGRMDVMQDIDDGEYPIVNLTIENVIVDLERSREFRYTSEDQAIDFAGDRFFDFVPDVQEKQLTTG